jgi:hypothetical protein
MMLARCYRYGIGDPNRLHRHITGACCAIAKLAVVIKTPVPNRSITFERNRM